MMMMMMIYFESIWLRFSSTLTVALMWASVSVMVVGLNPVVSVASVKKKELFYFEKLREQMYFLFLPVWNFNDVTCWTVKKKHNQPSDAHRLLHQDHISHQPPVLPVPLMATRCCSKLLMYYLRNISDLWHVMITSSDLTKSVYKFCLL